MTLTSEQQRQAEAFLQSYQSAESGDAEAQYQTGLHYAHGTGVAQDYRSAGLYWLSAAKQSHPAAQTHLGILFEKGLGYPQDLQKAIHCYQSAADLGFAEAKVRLAMLYLTGEGFAQDVKKAILLFIQAAEQGEAVAQYNLGIAYEKGLGGLKQNDDLAHFWYHQAAYQNHPQAVIRLQEAKFAKKAAKSLLATDILFDQPALIDSDTAVAATTATTATATDKTVTDTLDDGQTITEQQHHQQTATEQTTPEQTTTDPAAITKLTFAIDDVLSSDSQPVNFNDDDLPVHPDSEAIFARGLSTVHEDLKKAFNFFEQAALLGHAKAEYNMGLAFLYGLGGNHVCTETAIEWLEKSANQSFRPAYLVLGWLYQGGNPYLDEVSDEIGETIIIDHDNAISQFEMASELGHAQAQYFLAQLYANGNGVAVDADKSLAWLTQSAKHGYLAAVNQLRQSMPSIDDTNHD